LNPDLSVNIAGLKLKSPTILASGILGISGKTLRRVADSGAGAVVTKSCGIDAREGFPNPTIVEVPCGLLNAFGLPNPGVEAIREEIGEAKAAKIPVIASVYGFSKNDYEEAARVAGEAGADAVELNVSCPHVKEVGVEIGQKEDLVAEVTSSVKSKVNVPIIVKLSPNVSNIVAIGIAAERGGADALCAINTVRAMTIDIDVKKPILGAKIGGLSGPAIKPIAVRCIFELYEGVKIPIIGCGGVNAWQDAVEFLLAGAAAIQIGTAIMHKDLAVFKEIEIGLANYMRDGGFRRLDELVGLAH